MAGGVGVIPDQETNILHASGAKKKKKKKKPKNIKGKQCCNKFNKDFKMVHIKRSFFKKYIH